MKVILLQDVKKQGKKDDIINVSDGYAQNFLINKGLAVPYNEGNKKQLDHKLKDKADAEEALIKKCEEIKKEIEKKSFKFKTKSGKDGKMFGTISTKQIAEELKKNGYNIDKKIVELDHEINSLGTHIVKLNLHKKVVAEVKIITE